MGAYLSIGHLILAMLILPAMLPEHWTSYTLPFHATCDANDLRGESTILLSMQVALLPEHGFLGFLNFGC